MATFRQAWRLLGWQGRLRMLRSYGYMAQHRINNRVQDIRAVLAGACNASTWDEARGDYAGGYSHWRCAKRRGHTSCHRFLNYTWGGPGTKVLYTPVPVTGLRQHQKHMEALLPFQRHADGRKLVDTMRRTRVRARSYEAAAALRRAERRVSG